VTEEVAAEQHLERVMQWINAAIPPKFREGRALHGGLLHRKPVIGQIKQEVIDLCVYVATQEEQHSLALRRLGEAIAGQDWVKVAQAWNVLTYGNEDGTPEQEFGH
jgi:hypothetical protein